MNSASDPTAGVRAGALVQVVHLLQEPTELLDAVGAAVAEAPPHLQRVAASCSSTIFMKLALVHLLQTNSLKISWRRIIDEEVRVPGRHHQVKVGDEPRCRSSAVSSSFCRKCCSAWNSQRTTPSL